MSRKQLHGRGFPGACRRESSIAALEQVLDLSRNVLAKVQGDFGNPYEK
jgi:hypothetical protein